MDVLPFAVHSLPDTGFLELCCAPFGLVVLRLDETHVADNRYIFPKFTNVRRTDRSVASRSLGGLKVELMKAHTLDKMAARFRFKCCQIGSAKRAVLDPITVGDAV